MKKTKASREAKLAFSAAIKEAAQHMDSVAVSIGGLESELKQCQDLLCAMDQSLTAADTAWLRYKEACRGKKPRPAVTPEGNAP